MEHLTGWCFFVLFGVRDTPRCRGWAGLERPAQLSDVALANIEALASGEEGIIVGSTCMHHPDFWCVYPPMYGDPGMVLDGQIQYQGEDGAFTIPK